MKKTTILVLVALTAQLLFGSFVVSANELTKRDIENHWAEATIKEWLDKGYINGYSDGSFKPNASVTRAEFVKMVNRAFDIQKSDSIVNYSDLPEKHWAYGEIAAAAQAGYVGGTSATTVSPDAVIVRQEAAVMLVKLTKLEGKTELTFKDAADIPQWSKRAIEAIVAGGFMQGDPSGNFRAKDGLTRAEAVVLIDKLSKGLETVFDQAGEYGNEEERTTIQGNVRITTAGVTLLNTEITGDLIIDEAVGEGDVYLNNVKVNGTTHVNGGGENSIHLEDTILLRLIVEKSTGKVRIVASGTTSVQQVAVQSPVKLEESQLTDTGFSNIELAPALPAGSDVELIGHFESVHVMAASIQVKVPSGSIKQLNVGEDASNNTIDIDKSATVEKLVLDIVAKLVGEGTIKQAQISPAAEKSTFETKPSQVDYVDSSGNPMPSPTPEPENVPDVPIIPNPNPQPTDTLSDEAKLSSLTINEGLVLNKQVESAGFTGTVQGFDAEHFEYTVDLPADDESFEFTIKAETEQNAKIEFIAYNSGDHSGQPIMLEHINNELVLEVDPNENSTLEFQVASESGKTTKLYTIYLVGSWNVQDAFTLSEFPDSMYILTSRLVKVGDELTITIPAQHSKTGKAETITEIAGEQHSVPTGMYVLDYTSDIGIHFSPANDTGEIGIKLVRDNLTIYDGDYSFDFTPVTYKQLESPLDNELFKFQFKSKEDIDELNNSPWPGSKTAYEYDVNAVEQDIMEEHPNVKYWTATLLQFNNDYVIPSYSIGDVSPVRTYNYQHYRGLDKSFNKVYHYNEKAGQDVYEVPTGQVVRVHLFDEQKQLIGAYEMKFDVPEQYLAENVVKKDVVSEEEMLQLPALLEDMTIPGVTWYKRNYSGSTGQGFDSTHQTYSAYSSDRLTEDAVILGIQAAEGLQLSASIMETNMLTDESKTYSYHDSDEIRRSLEVAFKEQHNYYISVVVRNVYRNELTVYSFSILGERELSDAFQLKNFYPGEHHLISYIVQQGDILEITLPAERNSSGEQLKLEYTVEHDALSLSQGFVAFELKQKAEDGGQDIIFTPSLEEGSIDIKLTRQEKVIYNGKYEYDFTPLEKLEDASLKLLNVTNNQLEDEQYSWEFEYEVDFSDIEGAAYFYKYRTELSSNPSTWEIIRKQDLPPSSVVNSSNAAKILTTTGGIVTMDTDMNYFGVTYIVYDENKEPLGYVIFSEEIE